MGILQIIRLLSIPLCFFSTIGILFLFKKKRLYILILLLIGCIGWRLLSIKDSSRYAIALIIPTTILCGYAGDCFTKITKVASQKQLYIIIVVVSILAICFLEARERIARSTRLDDSFNILYNSIIPVFAE